MQWLTFSENFRSVSKTYHLSYRAEGICRSLRLPSCFSDNSMWQLLANVQAKSLQLCPTLCNFMDHSLPGSSVHGILQARFLEWVAMPSSRGSSQPRDWTCVSCDSCIAGRFFTAEPRAKPSDQHLVLFCSNEHLFRQQQGKVGQKYNLLLSHQYSHCQIFTPWISPPHPPQESLRAHSIVLSYHSYYFSVATITNHHKLGGFKQQNLILSQFEKPEVWNQHVHRVGSFFSLWVCVQLSLFL